VPGNDDNHLWRRVRSGDRKAFDALQVSLAPEVERFARRLLGPSEQVLEICQDAFMALYQGLDRLESGTHVRPFVFRVVRNLCYDVLRRQRRFDHLPVVEGDAQSTQELAWVSATQRRPEDDIAWALAMGQVYAAMDRLPEPQRQALILRFEMGLKYTEVAEALGVDVGTATSRVHYGRRGLRRLLGPEYLASLGFGSSTTNQEKPQCPTTTCAP